MAATLTAYKKDNVVTGAVEDSLLEKTLLANGYTTGGTLKNDYDAVPVLSQRPECVRTNADKSDLETQLAILEAGATAPTP